MEPPSGNWAAVVLVGPVKYQTKLIYVLKIIGLFFLFIIFI